jgi:hypothetical protein
VSAAAYRLVGLLLSNDRIELWHKDGLFRIIERPTTLIPVGRKKAA